MSDIDTSEPLGACPKCGGVFEALQVGAITVDRCGACQGLWLDERELEKVLAIDHSALQRKWTGIQAAGSKERARGKCPRCAAALISVTDLRADIVTDSCTVCYGVFLDAGELDGYDHPRLEARIGQFLRRLTGQD